MGRLTPEDVSGGSFSVSTCSYCCLFFLFLFQLQFLFRVSLEITFFAVFISFLL